jgi:ribose transport system permease protein
LPVRLDTLWILGVLVVLFLVFSVARPDAFPTVFNVRSIAVFASTLVVMGVGMTFVLITGGIDLSIGSVLVFSGVVAVKTMLAVGGVSANAAGDVGRAGWNAVIAGVLVGLAGGLFWGVINGLVVAKARVPALIVTLGTTGGALGVAQLLTGGADIRGVPTKLIITFGYGDLLGVPWMVVIAAIVSLIGGLILAFTRFGRYTYAIGSNKEAARRVGIDVDRHLIKVYAVSGLLSGLAGCMSLALYTNTTLGGHTIDNLSVITATVIGGTSLFGGTGTIFGTVLGVFIPAILGDGFVIVGLEPFWEEIAIGAVLMAAVYIDQVRRSRRRN